MATTDDGQSLRVGPHSVGAEPGPACYGRGGERPTVTDANCHLGRIDANHFLDGTMTLHPSVAAHESMAAVRLLNVGVAKSVQPWLT